MTQRRLTIDELLTRAGELIRAARPMPSPEELERARRDTYDRLATESIAELDAAGAVACTLCLTRRPRVRPDEPHYYSYEQCVNVRKPWHYRHVWHSRKKDARERRRHVRRVRKGRLPQTPATPLETSPAASLAWVPNDHGHEGVGHLLWELGMGPKPER